MNHLHKFKVIDDVNCCVKFYESIKSCYKYAEKCDCGEIRYWAGNNAPCDYDGEWRLHAVISKGFIHVVKDTNVYDD